MTPTDPTTVDPPDPDELAVHAVLDGEATPEERRRVARDPGLRARLAELRAAAEAMAQDPPSPATDVLDGIRARALASLDTEIEDEAAPDPEPAPDGPPAAGDGAPEDEAAPVAALPTRPPRRRLPPLPAVAAVVLVLLVVGVALIATGGGDADQSADAPSTTASASAEAGGSDADAATGGAASDEDSGAEAPAAEEALDLGDPGATYPDEQALRTALEQVEDPLTLDSLLPDPDAEAAAREAAASRCGDVLQGADTAIGDVQGSALVAVDDASLLVVSTPRAATRDSVASTRLFAVDPASCVPLLGVDR